MYQQIPPIPSCIIPPVDRYIRNGILSAFLIDNDTYSNDRFSSSVPVVPRNFDLSTSSSHYYLESSSSSSLLRAYSSTASSSSSTGTNPSLTSSSNSTKPPSSSSSGTPAEFTRGAVSAITNVILTFPINKLISRQAYEGLTWKESLHTMHNDGLRHFYRGIAPPLLQRAISVGTMFGMYNFWHQQLITYNYGPPPPTHIPLSQTIVHPSNDLSLETSSASSSSSYPQHHSKHFHPYRLTQKANQAKLEYEKQGGWFYRAIAGILAGSTEGLLTPFERIQTILQHRHYTEVFKNSWTVSQNIATYGIKEYYRGFTAIVLRNAPANAFWFTLRDPVKEYIPASPPPFALFLFGSPNDTVSSSSSLSSFPSNATRTNGSNNGTWTIFRDFLGGAVLGACISTFFYPINVIKSVMQLDIGTYHRSVFEAGKSVLRDRGVSGLYRGVFGNMVRSLLSWGIINSCYELAKVYIPDRINYD